MAAESDKIKLAIKEARRIRRNLMRSRGRYWKTGELAGSCGLASILLSIAIRDVKILRGSVDHVWAEIDKTIIDITATQFNHIYTNKSKLIKGVLVTKKPRGYHTNILNEGINTYLYVVNGNWYDKRDHPRWGWISEYWM